MSWEVFNKLYLTHVFFFLISSYFKDQLKFFVFIFIFHSLNTVNIKRLFYIFHTKYICVRIGTILDFHWNNFLCNENLGQILALH